MRRGQQEVLGSRSKIQRVFEQQEQVSQNFKLSNFYTNQRLNIAELKHRLEHFKRTHYQATPPATKVNHPSREQSAEPAKLAAESAAEPVLDSQKITLPTTNHRERLTSYQERTENNKEAMHRTLCPDFSEPEQPRRIEELKQSNYRIVKEVRRYEGKPRAATGNRGYLPHPRPAQSHYLKADSRGKGEGLSNSKCSSSSKVRSMSLSSGWFLEGKIQIENSSQLAQFEKEIGLLWGHYQLLTKILLGLREGTHNEKNAIVKYVEDVCSSRFEFLKDYLSTVTREGAQRDEHNFVKRLKKSIMVSRLLENMAIVYVGWGLTMRRVPEANLVNFVGYCCSNITFTIRWVYLLHSMSPELRIDGAVAQVMNVISQFEQESYKESISRISEVVLRMEHNNEVIGIVQGRLCNGMDRDFQKTVVAFLRNVDLESKPLYQYSHYIYEFLAYELAKRSVVGQFSFLEMAPSPYLQALPLSKTLVIEPWEVLLAVKGETTYIRSYSATFLKEVGKHCNIIYWTDCMPEFIDPLVEKLPPGKVLYRYHCRYENEKYLKLLWRLGTDLENTIILDRDDNNFKYDRQMGIALPWMGRRKDTKLLQLLELLRASLIQDVPFRQVFPEAKKALCRRKEPQRDNRLSEPKEEIESLLPRAMVKSKQFNRFSPYDHR